MKVFHRPHIFLLASVLAAHACGAIGTPCPAICDYYTECIPEQYDDAGLDCEWEDDDKETKKDCLEACTEEYRDLSGSDKKEVGACIRCVQKDIDGSCDYEDWYDATYDDCEDECDDDDVGDFFGDFIEEWSPDLECDYNYTYGR